MPTDRAPAGFIALADVAPTIRQDLRYTGSDNFVGSPLDGYRNATCVLPLPAALALSWAARVLARDGYALTALDGYRPQRAVDHMRRWAADPTDQATKARHYPRRLCT
ncbi:M15 family metallopeptidase [Nonomuraea sp. NPDC000554]|uniref:M15 family metallopeptidase n=1 Tax=Nonomuraea sp. NPDC000554 TaxID=3154259 RepID=UPI00332B4CFB